MYRTIIITVLIALAPCLSAQQNQRAGVIAFYNLENLFDTIDTPDVLDEEFTPEGPNKWTGKRYREKIDNMALAISRIGEDEGWKGGPAVIELLRLRIARCLKIWLPTLC